MILLYATCEFITTFIENFICYKFCGLIIKAELNNRKCLVLSALLAILLFFENYLQLVTIATFITAILFISLTSKFLFKIKLFAVLCVSLFYGFFLQFFDFFSLSILEIFFKKINFLEIVLTQESPYRCLSMFVSKSLLLLFYLIMRKVLIEWGKVKIQNLIFITFLGYVGFIYFAYNVFTNINIEVVVTGFAFFLIIMLTAFSFYVYVRYKEELLEKKCREISNQASLEKYNELLLMYENNAELYHNMNNHLGILKNLLQSGQYEESKRYLNSLSDLPTVCHTIWTGNEIIDCIINLKEKICQKNEIKFVADVDLLKKIEVDSFILSTIVSNLLDNAIEACINNKEEKWVYVAIRRIKDIVIIKTENPVMKGMELLLDPESHLPVTSKTNKKKHGWGMKSIDDAVKKAEGTFSYSLNNHKFVAVVALFL